MSSCNRDKSHQSLRQLLNTAGEVLVGLHPPETEPEAPAPIKATAPTPPTDSGHRPEEWDEPAAGEKVSEVVESLIHPNAPVVPISDK